MGETQNKSDCTANANVRVTYKLKFGIFHKKNPLQREI